jgi:general nucleoside transport system ATP-binding protein
MGLLLQTERLTKRFARVVANDGITFDIRRGEVHCLLGENGAGKSTLAKCLYGAYRPDSGTIRLKGQLVELNSPRDAIDLGIGMVHQHFILAPPLTVLENIIVGLESRSVLLDLKRAEASLQELCQSYGISVDLHARIWQLSVGEQQWVEILKALYVGAELLILDEPTAVLTPQETERLFAVLRQMTAKGLSVILITHKLHEVMNVSDRVTILRKGKLEATVSTAEVTKQDLAKMMVGREVLFRVEKERMLPGEPVLEINQLEALGNRGQPALRGITLTLHRNEILGLAGVAGNGQKELFEVLVGVRSAQRGSIFLEGENILGCSPAHIAAKGVGYVPDDRQKEGLVPDFSVKENLILGLQRSRQYTKWLFLDFERIRQASAHAVSTFEIVTPGLDAPVKVLSGGNQQKIILAREIGQCPQCLLANQPTRGLDVGVIEYVQHRLLEMRADGAGILLASEDLDELLNLSDRIAVIFRGEIMGIMDAQDASLDQIGLLMAGVREVAV